MKTGFVVALLAIAMLCASSLAQEDTANDWYKKGQSLIATGFGYNIDEALEAFDNAIQIEPQNIDAWLGKAQSLAYLDKKNESLEAFRNILNLTNETIKENPEDTSAWQSKGIALASLGREAEATDAFERSIELLNQSLLNDPKDAEAWWLKAENLELLGRTDSALEAYDKVIELNSSEAVGAWIRKSDIFYGQPGGYNQSQDAFGKAVDLMEVNSTSFISFWYPEGDHTIILNEWMIDGQIVRVDFGRYNRSIQAYDDLVQTRSNSGLFAAWQSKSRAITPLDTTLGKPSEYLLGSSPNWVVYNFSRADFPGNKGSADLQEGSFEDNSAEDWFNKGQELFRNGSKEEAVKAYDKAIELDPRYGWAWGGKATALSILGRYNESLEAYDKAIETWPANDTERISQLWVFKGVTLNSTGRQEDAFKAFEKALQIFPQNTDALMWKGEALENQGKYREAVEAYDIAIDAAPPIPAAKASALTSKGDALMGLGSYQEAYDAYDEAAEISSNSTDDTEKLYLAAALRGEGDALEAMGRHEEAIAVYDDAIDAHPKNAPVIYKKGQILKALGLSSEANAAFAEAKELGYEE
jgi:tetratricopeptide (TPR) repeat protein